MNVTAVHTMLVEAGYDVTSVSDDGHVDFATPKTRDDMLAVRKLMLDFKEPTRDELAQRILRDRDRLLDQLLLERFMPPETKADAKLSPSPSVRPV